MNRSDYHMLLEEIQAELAMPGGNFDELFGHDPDKLEQARFVAAVALAAADRLYSGITRQEFELRERDEHLLSDSGSDTFGEGGRR